RLHEDTAYGTVEHPETEDGANLVYRKTFVDISEKEIDRIRDRRLRDLVRAHVDRKSTRLNSQSHLNLVCRLLLAKNKIRDRDTQICRRSLRGARRAGGLLQGSSDTAARANDRDTQPRLISVQNEGECHQ